MNKMRSCLFGLLLGLSMCQSPVAHAAKYLTSAGPRFGVLYLTDKDTRNKLSDYAASRKENANVSPVLTAFGWQFEYEYLNSGGGSTGLIEFVPLVVGLESGLVLPSMNMVIGVRFANGFELGFGPSVSTGVRTDVANAGTPEETTRQKATVGVGMTGVVGMTMRVGNMNFPMNLATVRNENGYRVSLLFGWTL